MVQHANKRLLTEAQKGVPGGVVSLGPDGQILLDQRAIPSSLFLDEDGVPYMEPLIVGSVFSDEDGNPYVEFI